jgi:hypothetical protein
MDTKPEQVVGESMNVLGQLTNLAENFATCTTHGLGMATISGQTA